MEDEERKKKLQAGREKLAAFQRKRTKRKKRKKVTEDGESSDVYDSQMSETSSLADPHDLGFTSDMSALSGAESDHGSVMSEDFSEEEGSSSGVSLLSLERTRTELSKAARRITELEEALHGKQAALDGVVEENDRLRSSSQEPTQSTSAEGSLTPTASSQQGLVEPSTPSTSSERETDFADAKEVIYKTKLSEFESALKQRDEAIKQLTLNLQAATQSRDSAGLLQQEYMSQAQQLAQQVQTLQLQLQQAGEYLRNQVGDQHGTSVQALLEAKNEILALQQTIKQKITEITTLHEAVKQRDTALQQRDTAIKQMAAQCQEAAQQVVTLHAQNVELRERDVQNQDHMQKMISSVQEEMTTLRERDSDWTKKANEWQDREMEFGRLQENSQQCISEIKTLQETLALKDQSLQQMAVRLSETIQVSEAMVTRDQDSEYMRETLSEKENQLKDLKELLTKRDEELSERNTQLEAMHDSLAQKEQSLKALSSQLSQYTKSQEELVSLQEAFSNTSQNLESLQQNLQEKEYMLEEVKQKLKQKEDKEKQDMENLRETMKEKDAVLADLSSRLFDFTERNKELEAENKTFKDGQNESLKLQQELDSMKDIASKSKEYEEQIQQQLSEIQTFECKISELNKEIVAFQDHLNSKGEKITSLTEMLCDREENIKSLSQTVEENSSSIQEMSDRITHLTQELESVTYENEDLKKQQNDVVVMKQQLDAGIEDRLPHTADSQTIHTQSAFCQTDTDSSHSGVVSHQKVSKHRTIVVEESVDGPQSSMDVTESDDTEQILPTFNGDPSDMEPQESIGLETSSNGSVQNNVPNMNYNQMQTRIQELEYQVSMLQEVVDKRDEVVIVEAVSSSSSLNESPSKALPDSSTPDENTQSMVDADHYASQGEDVDIDKLHQTIFEQAASLSVLEETVTILRQENSSAREKHQESQEMYESLQQQCQLLQSELSSLQDKTNLTDQELKLAQSETQMNSKNVETVQEELRLKLQEFTTVQDNLNSVNEDYCKLQEEYDNLLKSLEVIQNENSQRKQDLESAQSNTASIVQEMTDLKNENTLLNEALQHSQNDSHSVNELLTATLEENVILKEKLSSSEEQTTHAILDLKSAEEALKLKIDEIELIQNEMRIKSREIESLIHANEKLKHSMESGQQQLSDELINLQQEIEGYKDREDALVEKERIVSERESIIRENESELERRTCLLQEKDVILTQKETSIAENEQTISERESSLQTKENALSDNETRLAEKELTLQERENITMQKETEIHTMELNIIELRKSETKVSELSDEIVKLKTAEEILSKEKCLLEETVRKTQENLQAYHDTLEQKESEVQQFQQAVVQFQQREAVFTQQVTQISQENLILKEQITSQTEEALQHKEEMKKLNWLTAENAALQSKISMSNDKIVKLQSQISEMPKLQEELEILRLRDNERELEMRTLQEKEKANSEVVKHMMFDIEQRRMEDSPAYQVGEPNSVDQHQKALEALQAELEELHGQQIVEMKQQLREQHSLEIEQVQKSSIEKHSQEFEQFQAECREEHSRELELIQKQLSESKTSALSIKEQHSQEIQLLQDDLRRFSESNNAANTDKVQLEKDLQHHRNEIQQLQNELKQLSANHMSVLAIKDQQEQDLRQEYASQLEQLQTQLKQMAQSQISEQTIKTQLYSELDNLNKEKEALAEKYHRSNQNSETLEHTIAEKDAVIQQQEEEKGFVESKLKSAYNQQQELFQKTASSNYDIISQLDQLRAQNSEYKDQIIELERNQHGSGTDLRNKLEAVERERDTVKAELKTVKITLFDYESRNPDLAVYRKKFDELNATLQVTWIENEELKAQVMNFKQQLGLDEPLEGATALNVDAGTVASTPLTSHSGDGTPSSSPSRGVKVLRRQIEQMKSEHAAEIENLRHDYEDVRAKLKEIEIERDSLRTKYEHEMRVKDKQHLESLTELSRQHQQVQSQLDRIHSEYREAQGKLQRSSEDRDIIQKQYNDALEKMRQEHSQVVAQMNRHIEQSTKTASPETADSIGNVQSAISGIGADQDQSVLITSERQELFIQRELLLAEKAQLVADRDSALQETEELKIVKQELNEKYAKLLSEKEELEGLKDTLVEMREINAELMKKNEILENEKEKVSLDNENISQELENVIITKGNMESLYQKDLKELENKISQLEEMVEYHKRSNEEIQGRFLSEADGSKDEIIQQLQIEIEHLRQTKENMNTEQSDMLDALQREHTEEVDNLRKQLIQLKDIEEKRNLAESQLEDKEREMVAYEEEYLRTVAGLNQEHDANIQDLQTQHQEDMNKLRNLIEELELEKSDLKAMQHGESVLVASEVITTSAAVPLSSERITCDYTSPLASSPHAQQEDQIAEWEGKLEDRRMDLTQALREQKYEMEWEHEVEMRKLRNELEIDHSENIKKLQEEFELRLIQKAESIKAEQELKFVEELRKARHELHRQSLSTEPVEAEAELETMVNKLKDENQELAEVRDALLNQIDCSHSQQMSLQEQIQTLHDHIHMAETDDVFVEEPHSGSFHEHVEEEEEEPSLQDSFEDYSEADLRAQINVLQRENLNLRNRLDDTNLTMLDGLQAELEDLQAKYTMVMKQKQTLDLSGEMGTEATGYQGLVLETDEGDVFSYEPPSHQMNNPEDYIDWKLRFEASEKEKDMLMHKLDSLSRTAQLSRHSQSVENLRARYETIMEENEVLRAKLGSYGLPTESTPEEDSFDFATKFDAVMKENENLRSKLDSYSMSSSQERDEDWRARYDSVIKDYEAMREYLEDNTMPLQDALLHGIQDLQSMYDSSIKDKENLQVKLDSICDQAEKDFAEHQAKYNKLIVEYQAFKAKFRRNREKSQKEHTKLKARFVAASKEIDVLKGKAESHGFEGDIVEDKDANDTEKNLTGAKDNLKSKNASLLAENKSLKSDNASLKGRLMDSFRTHLRETPPTQSSSSEQTTEALPLESPDTSNLEVKYSTACQEIVNLRSQLDAVQGRMLDDLNGYQAETEALAEKNEELGRNLDTKVQAAHLRIANLQSKCEDAIEMEESVTESIDWNTSMGDPGSDSDTSADSLNLEMETDYEVLVQEYERLKASGPEEIQRAYEAVVGHSRLEGSKKKGATEQNIAGEAKVTPQRGDSAKLRKRGKAKQKSEVVTDNTAQLGAEIDDESNDRQIGKENALLESLKTQYEDQVDQLKQELEQERLSQAKAKAALEDMTASQMPDSSTGPDEGSQGGGNPEFQDAAVSAQQLDQQLQQLREQLEIAHNEDLGKLKKQHEEDVRLQLEALKLTLSQVHKSQLELTRSELEKDKENRIAELESELQGYKDDLACHDAEKEEVKTEAEWIARMLEVKMQVQEEQGQLREADLEKQKKHYEERIAKLTSDVDKATAYIQNLQTPLQQSTADMMRLKEDREEFQLEIQQLQAQLAQQQQQLEDRQQQILHLQEKVDNREKGEKDQEQKEHYEQKIADLQEQLEHAQSEVGRLQEQQRPEVDGDAEMVELRQKLEEAQGEVERLKEEVEHGKKAEDELEQLKNDHQVELERLQSQLAAQAQELSSHLSSPSGEEADAALSDPQITDIKLAIQREYEEEQARFVAQHQQMMDQFIEDREKVVADMKEKHRQELEALHNNNSTEMPVLEEDLSALANGHSPQQLKERFEGDALAEKWESERLKLAEREEETLSKHQTEMEAIRQQHLEQLDNIRISIKEELLAENMKKLGEMTAELEKSHLDEIEEVRDDLDRQYKERIAALERQLEAQGEETEKYMGEVQEKHQVELQTVRSEVVEEVVQEHTDQLQAAALDTDAAKVELDAAHGTELQQIRSRYEEKMEALEKQHTEAMEKVTEENERLRDQFNAQIQQLKEQYNFEKQSELSHQREQMEKQISALKLQLGETGGSTSPVMSPRSADVAMEDEDEEDTVQMRERHRVEMCDRAEQIERLTQQLSGRMEEVQSLQRAQEEMARKLEEQKQEYELMLGRRDREHEEEDNLNVMLQTDLNKAKQDRESIQQANERLRNILSDTVMATITTEDRINRQLANIVSEGRRSPRTRTATQSDSGADAGGGTEEDMTHETSTLSMYSDEGLDLSQRISESLFMGPDVDADSEIVTDSGNRLQAAVDNLLDLIATTTRQLQEAQVTQRELAAVVTARTEELEQAQQKVEDMEARTKEETEARQYLAVELNKAEGLLEGYASEKKQTDESLRSLEDGKEALIVELERTRTRLIELEEAQTELEQRENNLVRQKEVLEQSMGQEEQADLTKDADTSATPRSALQGLLQENSRLLEEKLEVQKQLDKERETLESRIAELEMMVEDAQTQYEQQLDDKKVEIDDLHRQVEALDKKVKSQQQFLEEQANEREQEREDFQKEMQRLQLSLKEKERQESQEHRLQREVQDLEEQLRDRIDTHSELLLRKEQLDRDITSLQVSVTEQTDMIRHLEEELDSRAKTENSMKSKLTKLEGELSRQQEVNVELSAEMKEGATMQDLQQAIKDLEGQLEHARKSEQLALQKKHELEEEVRNLKSLEEELMHDKKALQAQVIDQMTQLSTLKSQVEDLKLGADLTATKDVKDLRKLLAQEREALEEKDKEIHSLANQLVQFREQYVDKDDELQQVAAQRDISEKERHHHLGEMEEKIQQLQEENHHLQVEIQSLHSRVDSTPMPVFTQNLIDEKNQEIDELNEQLQQLQKELQTARTTVVDEEQLERLKIELAEKNVLLEERGNEVEELQATVDRETQALQPADGEQALNAELAEKENLIKQLTIQVRDLQAEIASLSEEEGHVDQLNAQIAELQAEIASLSEKEGHVDQLTAQVAELQAEIASLSEKEGHVDQLTAQIAELQAEIASLSEKESHVDQPTTQVADVQAEISSLMEKEGQIEQLTARVADLQAEIASLTEFQSKLQEDFDTVQAMLEVKQQQIETLTQQAEDTRPQVEGVSAEVQEQYEEEVRQLQKEVREKDNIIEEKAEELYVLQEKQEDLKFELQEAKQTLEEKTLELSQLQHKMEDMGSGTPGDLDQIEAPVQHQLLGEAIPVQAEHAAVLTETEVGVSPGGEGTSESEAALRSQIQAQQELIERLQDQLSLSQAEVTSRQEQYNRAIAEMELQTRKPTPDGAGDTEEQMRNSLAESERRVEILKEERQVELEHIKQEQQRHLEEVKREIKKKHNDDLNKVLSEHEAEMNRWKNIMEKSISDDESIMELGRRVQSEIDANEQIDTRLLDQLSAERPPGGDTSDTAQELAGAVNGEISERLQAVLTKVHKEGVRVLSLSELQLLRQHQPSMVVDSATLQQALKTSAAPSQQQWEDERRSLLAAIQSLKDLLINTQMTSDASRDGTGPDWRSDLLHAVGEIFSREREGLLSELRSYSRSVHGQDLPQSAVERLEKLIKEQDGRQTMALKDIMSKDRQSLMTEIQDLQEKLRQVKLERQEEQNRVREELTLLEEQYSKRERHLKRQLELMEYKVQQEKVVSEDLSSSLEVEKSRSLELASMLSREKNSHSDLQAEVAETQTQISKLKDALDREQTRLVSASGALDEERKKTNHLQEALTYEQATSGQYVEELDAERQRGQRQKDRSHQIIERLKRDYEMEKERRQDAVNALERDRMTLASLRRELDLEKDQHHSAEAKHKSKVTELRTTIDMEKARVEELQGALQRERQLNAQLRETLDEERGLQSDTSDREKAAITDLQAMLDLERSKMLDIHTALEKERYKVQSLNGLLDAERQKAAEEMEQERATCRHLKNTLDALQVQKQELQRQIHFEEEKVGVLRGDCERLQASLLSTKDRLHEVEARRDNEKVTLKHRQRDMDRERQKERQKQFEQESELHRMRQKLADVELQLAESRHSEIQAREERDLERLRNAMSPSRSPSHASPHDDLINGRMSPGDTSTAAANIRLQRRHLESLRQRLHSLLVRHEEELSHTATKMSEEGRDWSSEFEAIRASLKELMSELQKVHNRISQETGVDPTSVAALNEKILQHNGELTSLISQLSDEKHELFSRLARMEDQIRGLKQQQLELDRVDEAEERLSSERAQWSQDRAALGLQLHESEKEAVKLRTEVRKLEIQLEREREKFLLPTNTSASADREKMQRLYGKYLRAESFRKALVYQKKYLLLLLGGFQDCEEATLSMIAKMGVYPQEEEVHAHIHHPRPFTRFRSAARVVVAVSRMKFLVKKWRRATRVGSPVIAGNISQSGAINNYMPTSQSFSPPSRSNYSPATSTRLHTLGGAEHYAWDQPRNGASDRSNFHMTPPTRDISEDIRSATQHSHHSPARRKIFVGGLDLNIDRGGPLVAAGESDEDNLPASPSPQGEDESLNAYIERLENLQARLGNVAQYPRGFVQSRR